MRSSSKSQSIIRPESARLYTFRSSLGIPLRGPGEAGKPRARRLAQGQKFARGPRRGGGGQNWHRSHVRQIGAGWPERKRGGGGSWLLFNFPRLAAARPRVFASRDRESETERRGSTRGIKARICALSLSFSLCFMREGAPRGSPCFSLECGNFDCFFPSDCGSKGKLRVLLVGWWRLHVESIRNLIFEVTRKYEYILYIISFRF